MLLDQSVLLIPAQANFLTILLVKHLDMVILNTTAMDGLVLLQVLSNGLILIALQEVNVKRSGLVQPLVRDNNVQILMELHHAWVTQVVH